LSAPKKIQKAVTPKLLRALARLASYEVINNAEDHAVDLVIAAFFFAMRSCEFVHTPTPGQTKMITLGCITFFTADRKVIKHSDPKLEERAEFVRVKFEDQKNGEKSDFRSQRKTNDNILCPVKRFVRVVQRIRKFIPKHNKKTPLCSVRKTEIKAKRISQTYTRELLRKACRLGGGQNVFGFSPKQIGNKSIRSGSAMSLFLMGHSAEKIMLLGRWKSTCFLDYLRPQVVEWVNLFSVDMISIENFFELFTARETKKTDFKDNDFEIPSIHRDYERRNGRLRNSVFNRKLSLGKGSHTLYACAY
jgi:hypothetical protein